MSFSSESVVVGEVSSPMTIYELGSSIQIFHKFKRIVDRSSFLLDLHDFEVQLDPGKYKLQNIILYVLPVAFSFS